MTLRGLAPWGLPILALGIVLAWVQTFVVGARPQDILFVDWWAYTLGTERLLAGESLYLAEQVSGPYRLPDVTPEGYIYPPPAGLLFLPFTPRGGLGLALWLAANLGLLLAGVASVVSRELGGLRPVPLAVAFLALGAALPLPASRWVAPLPDGLVNANINVGLAGVVALCWGLGRDRRWVAVVAGALAAVKLFPGALAFWAARREGLRPIAVAIGVGAGIAVITLPFVGIEEWVRFATALSNAQPTCDGGRISLACLVQPLVGATLAKLSGAVVAVVLVLASLRIRSELAAFVVLIAGMLAVVTDGHHHYLLFAYVLVIIVACRLWAVRTSARGVLETTARSS